MDTEPEVPNKLRDLLNSISLSVASVVTSMLALVVFLGLSNGDQETPIDQDSIPAVTVETAVPNPFSSPTVTTPKPGEEVLPSSWTQAGGPGVGGRVTSLAFSPVDSSLILAAGDLLGVVRSADGGQSWQTTTGFTNWEIGDLVFDPSHPSRVWAGTMAARSCPRTAARHGSNVGSACH